MKESLEEEIQTVSDRIEGLFENVNICLKEATKEFYK